jgi:hypothetical protein
VKQSLVELRFCRAGTVGIPGKRRPKDLAFPSIEDGVGVMACSAAVVRSSPRVAKRIELKQA